MKWRFQFALLVSAMVCLVIGGIHLAEKGTQRVDGIKDSSQSFHIARSDSGKLEMTVLGKHYQVREDGVVPMGEIDKGKNWFSQTGNTFGGVVSKIAKTVVSWIEKR